MANNRVDEFVDDYKKALFTLSAPMVFGILIQTLYGIVDMVFIGRLGNEAVAALTISFPLYFIILAVGTGLGSGINAVISKFVGAKDKNNAENTVIHGFYLSLIVGILTSLLTIIFAYHTFLWIGASGDVLKYASEYINVIGLGVLMMVLSIFAHNVLVAQGNAKTPMMIYSASFLMNIILDPIFIFVFKLGVKGAAIATVISMGLSTLVYFYFINRGDRYIRLKFSAFNFSKDIAKKILNVGVPAAFGQGIMSLGSILLNSVLIHLGVVYTAAFGISMRLMHLGMIPLFGISSALLTLTGMFYGAKEYALLKKSSLFGIKAALVMEIAISTIFFIFSGWIIKIFTKDALLIETGTYYLRGILIILPLAAIGLSSGRIIQGLGKGLPALIITSIRVILVTVPLAYILVYGFKAGLNGVIIAMVSGALASATVAVFWLASYFKKLKERTSV